MPGRILTSTGLEAFQALLQELPASSKGYQHPWLHEQACTSQSMSQYFLTPGYSRYWACWYTAFDNYRSYCLIMTCCVLIHISILLGAGAWE